MTNVWWPKLSGRMFCQVCECQQQRHEVVEYRCGILVEGNVVYGVISSVLKKLGTANRAFSGDITKARPKTC